MGRLKGGVRGTGLGLCAMALTTRESAAARASYTQKKGSSAAIGGGWRSARRTDGGLERVGEVLDLLGDLLLVSDAADHDVLLSELLSGRE